MLPEGRLRLSPYLGTITTSTVILPRVGPKPLVTTGLLMAAGGMALLTRVGVDSTYGADGLPALLVLGLGLGMAMATAMNTATLGRALRRRQRRLGQRQHDAADRRLDRHRAAEHDRRERDEQLHGIAPLHCAGRRPRIHDGVRVVV